MAQNAPQTIGGGFRNWRASRSGAAIRVSGFLEHGTPHKFTAACIEVSRAGIIATLPNGEQYLLPHTTTS